ncbi:MAG: murein biosynthesis integral membrane protein MurJ [Defluviitaleaceae bacterium]|nr:murein biosynthesis integral membrane protein MurJ [Defluviitaleaceae bacterium]
MKNDIKPAKTVAIMMAITMVGKLLGVLRDSMQSAQFGGDTAEAIAFVQASVLPRNFLDVMFAAAFSASFIPVFSSYLETTGKKAAFDLAGLFISVVLVLTTAVVLLSIIFARPIFILSVGNEALPYGTVSLGATLLRYMFPLMILSGLAFSFTGILQSLGEFRIPAAMSAVSNTIILVYYFFFIDRFGVYGLAVAFLIGWGSQALIQVPFLVRHKFRFRFRINLKDAGLRQIGRLALPVMVSSWVVPINMQVNMRAAAGLYGGEFGVAAIFYANGLFAIISGIFILNVSNVILPRMARQAATKDSVGFSETVNETVRVLLFFLLPLTFGLMTLSQPLVRLVHGRGLFGDVAVQITGTALFFFALGIVGFGLFTVLSRACYARMDGRTPIVAAVVAMVVNAALSFALVPYLQIAGPALAGTVAQTVGAGILVVSLTRKGVLTWPRATMLDIGKMLVIALVMFAAVYFAHGQMAALPAVLKVGICAVLGVGVYIGLAALLRIKEMRWLAKNLLRK